MAHVLQLEPDTDLQFVLSYSDETARCTMILRHTGASNEYLAFKVKTTQPRRYLVRPNQGLVAPGQTEKVAILLVDKDKQALLKSYESLGQSALDHAKDKFLVQSCTVADHFSSKFAGGGLTTGGESKNTSDNSELYEALNTMWSSVTGGSAAGGAGPAATSPVLNKKLHVRLFVKDGASGGGAPAAAPAPGGRNQMHSSVPTPAPAIRNAPSAKTTSEILKPIDNTVALETLSPEQLLAEVSTLRRKYDELVSFSVNLTAERDILNNTLEQTKRELNREVAARASLENRAAGGSGAGSSGALGSSDDNGRSTNDDGSKKKNAGSSSIVMKLLPLLVVGIACFLAGIREKNYGRASILERLPVLGEYLTPPAEPITTPETTKPTKPVEASPESTNADDDGGDGVKSE